MDGVVDLALGDGGGLGDVGNGDLARRTCGLQGGHGGAPVVGGGADRADVGGALHDDGDLAADALGGPGDEVGQGAAAYLLVRLGQLAADRGGPVGPERP